jgi:hypothetical protein
MIDVTGTTVVTVLKVTGKAAIEPTPHFGRH